MKKADLPESSGTWGMVSGVPREQILGGRQHPGFLFPRWLHCLLFEVLTFFRCLWPLGGGCGGERAVEGEEALVKSLLV